MNTLEESLQEIAGLKRDLNAERIVQAERGHEQVIPGSDRGSGPCSFDKVWDYEYIIDEPEIREPDTKRKETAKRRLTEIYSSCSWYSARYAAGRLLGVESDEFEKVIRTWSDILHEEMGSDRKETESRIGHGVDELYSSKGYIETTYEYEVEISVPDVDRRLRACEDAAQLLEGSGSEIVRRLLEYAYKRNRSKEVRKQAGKALGYARVRMWVGELLRKLYWYG